MLDANLKGQLGTYLERVTMPVELRASLDDGAQSQELRAFLEDIASLSDKITVTDDASGARVPSFEIARAGTDVSVRFAGIPLGHEFTSLVLALRPDLVDMSAAVAGYGGRMDDATAQRLFEHGTAALSPVGVLGDARPASAARGERYLTALVDLLYDHFAPLLD